MASELFWLQALLVAANEAGRGNLSGGISDDAQPPPKGPEPQGFAVRRSSTAAEVSAEGLVRKQEPPKRLEECDGGADGVVVPAAAGTAVLSGRVVARESTSRAAALLPLGCKTRPEASCVAIELPAQYGVVIGPEEEPPG